MVEPQQRRMHALEGRMPGMRLFWQGGDEKGSCTYQPRVAALRMLSNRHNTNSSRTCTLFSYRMTLLRNFCRIKGPQSHCRAKQALIQPVQTLIPITLIPAHITGDDSWAERTVWTTTVCVTWLLVGGWRLWHVCPSNWPEVTRLVITCGSTNHTVSEHFLRVVPKTALSQSIFYAWLHKLHSLRGF